jgi:DNA-binding Lrp family transcriptional regulator
MRHSLGLSNKQISAIYSGIEKAPRGDYEALRNFRRRETTKALHTSGYEIREAGEKTGEKIDYRRLSFSDVAEKTERIERIIDTLHGEWNTAKDKYNAMSPDEKRAYRAKHGGHSPRGISRSEVARRIRRGLKSKSIEEIENY